jgi:hypothetical protein
MTCSSNNQINLYRVTSLNILTQKREAFSIAPRGEDWEGVSLPRQS